MGGVGAAARRRRLDAEPGGDLGQDPWQERRALELTPLVESAELGDQHVAARVCDRAVADSDPRCHRGALEHRPQLVDAFHQRTLGPQHVTGIDVGEEEEEVAVLHQGRCEQGFEGIGAEGQDLQPEPAAEGRGLVQDVIAGQLIRVVRRAAIAPEDRLDGTEAGSRIPGQDGDLEGTADAVRLKHVEQPTDGCREAGTGRGSDLGGGSEPQQPGIGEVERRGKRDMVVEAARCRHLGQRHRLTHRAVDSRTDRIVMARLGAGRRDDNLLQGPRQPGHETGPDPIPGARRRQQFVDLAEALGFLSAVCWAGLDPKRADRPHEGLEQCLPGAMRRLGGGRLPVEPAAKNEGRTPVVKEHGDDLPRGWRDQGEPTREVAVGKQPKQVGRGQQPQAPLGPF